MFTRRKQHINLMQRLQEHLARLGIAEHMFMVFIAMLIGLLSGYGAILLRLAIKEGQVLFFGMANPTLQYLNTIPWYMKIIIPAAGGLVVGLVIFTFSKEVKGHGVPEVMEALALQGGVIRPRVVLAKIVASATSIASGGSVGREGPIVQIGAAMGSTMGQWLNIMGSRLRTLVGCGTAAGIAAAFNAPIAGALFAVEVVLEDFAVAHFSPIVISSVTATIISRHFFGNFPAFEVPHYELVSAFEMIPYALLGIIAGIAGIIFIRLLYWSEDIFEAVHLHPMLKPAIGAGMIGLIAFWYPHVYGVGYETMNHALMGNFGGLLLLAIFFAKLLATALTLGSGGSGGIFAPSLFMGSMLGGVVGTYFHHAFPHQTAGLGAYALVGMGAMVAGTIHAPITAIIIIFELTNDYRIILPLMVACILSTIISTRFQRYSIYTLKLARRGVHLKRGQDINILKDLPITTIMDSAPVTLQRTANFETILNAFISTHHVTLFVVNPDGSLAGQISFDHLRRILPEWQDVKAILVAEDLITSPMAVLDPEDTLDRAMHIFATSGEDELPVASTGRILLGTLSKSQAIEGYNRELLKRDAALDIREGISGVTPMSEYTLSRDYILSTIPVPPIFEGKTLGELQLRSKFNVEVVLVKKEEKEEAFMASAQSLLMPGESLIVIGKKEDIETLKAL